MITFTLLTFLLLFLVVLITAEMLFRFFKLPAEITRRVSHLLGGLIVFSMPSYLNLSQAVSLALIFFLILVAAEKFNLLPAITKVKRESFGSFLFPLGLLVSGLLFWDRNVLAFKISVLVLALSDSLAGLVGERFGKKRFLSGTTAGSLVFFAVTLTIFLIFGLFQEKVDLAHLAFFVFASLLLTFLEANSNRGFDNLFLPIAAGFLASLSF